MTSLIDMSLSKLWEMVKDREAWCAAVHGVTKSQTRLKRLRTHVTLNTIYNGYEFEQALGDGEGQGSLACCSPWSPKVGHE